MFQPSFDKAAPLTPEPPPPSLPTRAEQGGRALLRAVRARQVRHLWFQGGAYGLAVWMPLILAAGFLSPQSAFLGQATLVGSLAGFAAMLVYFALYRARELTGDEGRLARLVGERVPGVSLDLLAAVELERERGLNPSGSESLTQAFLTYADKRVETVDARRVVNQRAVRMAMWTAAGSLLLCGTALAWCGASAWVRGMAALVTARDADRHGALAQSVLSELELTYRYPAYTELPSRTVPSASGEIAAPAGTEVLIKARSALALDRAELSVNHQPLPLQLLPNRELRGSLLLDQSGAYTFVVYRRGRQVAQSAELPIRVQADEPPQVVIQTPGEEVEVDPSQRVVVKYEASDDYGLRSLKLIYQLPRHPTELQVPLPRDAGRKTKGTYGFDLGRFKLAPGDRLVYRIEATDNDGVAGGKKGASRPHVLRVYSSAEHRREAAQKVEAIWERLLSHQADRMEGPDRKAAKDPKEVAAQQGVDQAGLSLTAQMRELSQQLSSDKDAPNELWAALDNIGRSLQLRIQGIVDGRRNLLLAARLQASTALPSFRLSEGISAEINELERDALYLESLLDRRKMADLQNLSQELLREKRQLTQLLEQHKRTPDPKLRESILEQIGALKKHIDQLMQRMSELAKGIRDEHLNSEALQDMLKQESLGATLDEVESLVREGKSDEALRKLQQLGLEMEKMVQGLEGAQEGMDEKSNPELAFKYEQFQRELQNATDRQQRLSEETRTLRDRYRDQARQKLARKQLGLRESLLKQTAEIRKDLQGIGSRELNPASERPLEEASSELDNLQSALKSSDFDLAADAASRAFKASEELAALGERSPVSWGASQKTAERLENAHQRMGVVQRQLKQLFPEIGPLMNERDLRHLQQMGGEQKQLQGQARALKQRLSELGQMAPVFGEEAQEQMSQVGDRMEQASDAMNQRDPSKAYAEQKAALDQLSNFEKQMKENRGSKGGKGLPLPMFSGAQRHGGGNPDSTREKVDIPEADPFQAPGEFRKDLLDAMKENAPDSYRDQVKRYYEELVK